MPFKVILEEGITELLATDAAGTSIGSANYGVFESATHGNKVAIIELPSTLTNFGNYSFSGCTGLTSITFASQFPPTIVGTSVFSSVPNVSTSTLDVPCPENYTTRN